MKKILALLLCISCLFPFLACAAGETLTVGPLECTLPEGFVVGERDENGFSAQLMGYEPGMPNSYSLLEVCVNDTWNFCEKLGLTLNGVKETLSSPDSDSVYPLVNGGPALFLNGSTSTGELFAFCACSVGQDVYIAIEYTSPSQYIPGTYALTVLNHLSGSENVSFLGGMKGIQQVQTGMNPEYPAEAKADIADADIFTADENGNLTLFRLDLNTPSHDYLTALAQTSGCSFYSVQFGKHYVSDCFVMPAALGPSSPMAIVSPGDGQNTVDIKLVSPEGTVVTDVNKAVDWCRATAQTVLEMTGREKYEMCYVSASDANAMINDMETALTRWTYFCENMEGEVHLQLTTANVIISLEKVQRTVNGENIYVYESWIVLIPAGN